MHSWQGYCSAYNKSNSKVQRRLHLAFSLIASLLVPKRSFLAGLVKSPNRWRSLAHLAITLRPPALATTM